MKIEKTKLKSKGSQDIKNCRVSDVELNGFAECQMEGPNKCPYAMAFGYGFLCQHPRLDEILVQTKQQQAAAV